MNYNTPDGGIDTKFILSLDNNVTFESPIDSLSLGAYYSDLTTGQYIVAGNRRKSADGGATWVPLDHVPAVEFSFDNAGAGARWVGAGTYINYTDDFYLTVPQDKQGNMPSLNPFYHCDLVKVLSF
ncbi:MAG: hypothetical protein ABI904_23765 [Chloroflexota bacterium]